MRRPEDSDVVRRSACALVLLAFATMGSTASAEGRLAIEDAVKLALATNARALKAPLRVEAAEGQLERARAAFLPSLVASGTATGKSTADRNGRYLAGTGTLSLTQPLFNLPAYPLYAQARHQLESERWGAIEDRRLLAFDAAHAFLIALSAERLLEAGQRRLDRARAEREDARARADAGLTSSNDVTRAEVAFAAAENQLAQLRGNVDRAYLQLAFLVGRPVTGPLAAPVRTTRAAESGAFRMEDVLRFAESRRPDVRSAFERTEALRAGAKEPLYRLAPTLGASAQLRTTAFPVPPDAAHDEQALVTLTWTLYDAGARYGDRRTRAAQAESQALDEQQLRRSIATDVGLALVTIRAARESHRISEEAAAAARRSTEETEILYRQGLARAIELTEANASRFQAEVDLETAKLAMEQAYLGLRQALGLDPLGDELGPGTSGGAP
jgi:outer membrane protein TolC